MGRKNGYDLEDRLVDFAIRIIGGFSLFMGLSVPFYFSKFSSGAADLLWVPEGLRGMVLAVGSTGMAVAACIGLILENLIPGTREERGLEPISLTEQLDGN